MAANPGLPSLAAKITPAVAAPADCPAAENTLAIFDLDGTITRGDTLFPFLRHALGNLDFFLLLVLALPVLAAMALHLLDRDTAKRAVLWIFLRGIPRAKLEQKAASFARDVMPRLMRPGAAERLAWHRGHGHRCVLASASPDLYVEAWARAAGFDDVIATRLRYDSRGFADGGLVGANCRGAEKLRRLEALLGELRDAPATGYGDTADDKPFLARCRDARFQPFREAARHSRARTAAMDLVRLMRPHQWVKNGFVLVGVLFGHVWVMGPVLAHALLATAAFCLLSSAVYIVNDYADRERDRAHPRKRNRPLASGRVKPRAALALAALLALGAASLALAAGPLVLLIAAAYVVMNLGYSFALKNVVVLDVFVIAAGFILRILAGTIGIGIPPSQWLLVCSLFLTLFLGFTKRRCELLALEGHAGEHRSALSEYNPALLDKMIGVSAGAALMGYSLYTTSPVTIRLHSTEGLVYTIPFVVYGLFRYLYLMHAKHGGSDTSRDIMCDPHLALTVTCWIGVTCALIA